MNLCNGSIEHACASRFHYRRILPVAFAVVLVTARLRGNTVGINLFATDAAPAAGESYLAQASTDHKTVKHQRRRASVGEKMTSGAGAPHAEAPVHKPAIPEPARLVTYDFPTLLVDGKALHIVGAYKRLRRASHGTITVLALYEHTKEEPLKRMSLELPSGTVVPAKHARQIRHRYNLAVLVDFELPPGESVVGESETHTSSVKLLSGGGGGTQQQTMQSLEVELIVPDESFRNPQTGRRHEVVHCLGSMHGTINVATMIEWIEYHHAMGVDHFHVYDKTGAFNGTGDLHNVLQAYAAQGVLTYHDWHGVGCVDDHTCEADTRFRYTYHGQDFAIHDCFLREESQARWITFGDLDEMWVVEDGGKGRTEISLLPPLEALYAAEPDKHAWLVKKVWVMTNDEYPRDDAKSPLLIGRYTRKHRIAAEGLGGGGRVKYAIRTNYGDHKVELPMQVHEAGANDAVRGVIKPRKDVDDNTSPNKAGVALHFNHYETRSYALTNHLRSMSASKPPHEVFNARVVNCTAMSLGLISYTPEVERDRTSKLQSVRDPRDMHWPYAKGRHGNDNNGDEDNRELSCRVKPAPEVVKKAYALWRNVSMKVPQTASPFMLDRTRLGAALPCATCGQP